MGVDRGFSLVFYKIKIVVMKFLGFFLSLVKVIFVIFCKKMFSKVKEVYLGFVGGLFNRIRGYRNCFLEYLVLGDCDGRIY